DPERADRSLLFNAEHPDADDALHTEYVDDGLGWVDADGARFWFVAPYVEWGLWRRLGAAVSILSWSYAYTGEQRYAHKAAVLLDRIADLYPDMDKAYWLPDNMKGTGGKILDSVWENGFLGGNVIYPYDIIHDAIGQDDELVAFLSAQAARYILPNPKTSADLIRANIDHNLVREMLLSMEEGVIDGNVGMCERSVAYCGIALGDTPEVRHALEWVFSDEGNALQRTMVEAIDRDGVGAESSPGYSLSWCSNLGYFATLLHDYGDAPPEYDLMRHPKFSRMMEAAVRLVCLDRFTPNIGDCGSTGKLDTVIPQTELLVKLFLASKNPAVAKAIYFKTDGNLAGLHYPVTEPDPERVREEITRIARPAPNEDFTSENLAGYGLCKLQSGRRSDDSGRCLWVSYGRNGGAHPHQDRLGTGLVAKGIDLSPEMGYPEFTGGWPKRRYWTDVSISHNTVTVDTQAQLSSFCGGVGFFKASGDIDVVDLTSPQIYDQCDRFDRQISLIDVSPEDSYVVDVFAVRGGKDHIYSYHGPEGPVTVDGLQLVTQKAGTYAGPEFAYPERGLGP
ncbi:MAG: hypothetical protein GX616_00425, partial [Planctomycetes bacterium]|nr:hypothetical protein [Planctomycetota bacterium]